MPATAKKKPTNPVKKPVAAPLRQIDTNDPQTQALLQAIAHREKYGKIQTLFLDKGKHRRFLYKKHLAHFKAGKKYNQRLFMAANRIGKTTMAGAELTYHLTGEYPQWWEGRRYRLPQEWWVCGKYAQTIRDILQSTLLGPVGEFGSGLIPQHLIDHDTMTAARKMDTSITDFRVKHSTGEWSTVGFRSYDQGRKAFEGTEKCIWLDEEPPLPIFQECLTRTMTRKNGDGESMMMMTFTPLEGLSETVMDFLGEAGDFTEGAKGPGKWVTLATWDDVPHLSKDKKEELLASYPVYQRDARSKGIPALGEGVVYPFSMERVFIESFPIPDHFKRVFALDFGFNPDPTAILWAAIDPATEVVYVYAEHYLRMAEPMVHAAVIKQMDRLAKFTIPGVCDPSGGGSSTADGKQTREVYRKEYQVNLISAINSIEPGITTVMDHITRDKLKIFNTCQQVKREYQLYRRNAKGNPIGDDHLMDDLRYLIMSGIHVAKSYDQIQQAKMIAESSEGRSPFGASYWSQYDM
jgi:phage terminase large subunit-like protein